MTVAGDGAPEESAGRTTRAWLIRRNPDFRRFWAGQSVSALGDQITRFALPTVALVSLHVSPWTFGLLSVTGFISYPVIGLFAGAWVDRLSRRRVLIGANAVRLVAVGTVPLAAASDALSVPLLFGVSLVSGAATCFFDAAYQAYLPSVVPADDLAAGNALLEVSTSTAQVAGPSLAGLLIGAIGAAYTLVVDAASYLVSIVSLTRIRGREEPPAKRRRSLLPEVREGLVLVWRHPLLRRLTTATALANVGRGLALEMFLLFAYRGLGLPPVTVGLMTTAGSVAALAGAMFCRALARRLGIGHTLLVAGFCKGVPWLLTPLALIGPAIPVMMAITFASGFFISVWNVNTVTLRQYMTDTDVLGRVSATVRTVTWSVIPLTGLLGGGLATVGTALWGSRVGLAAVLALGGAVWAGATLALPLREIGRVRESEDAVTTYGRIATPRPPRV
ncbi:MFS transporter [Streptomyces litchfieldiae]|uniref:MFS transporter n=1 Tax=Streptomyces litchfieldiae TaxID=3075543 RepID=A0ABU2MQH3_9ACTN|nr:MFS transporter [Streptomyces sp. DSM 44938]MDT0343603.1 MFS transporter [Streptomyces sp. DSM 44938]